MNKNRGITNSVSCIHGQCEQVATLFINSDVRDITAAWLVLKLIYVYPAGSSKHLDSFLLAVIDPEAAIELNDRDVVDVMEACLADSLS